MSDKRSHKEKIAALSRAVIRNEGSPVSQDYYHREAIRLGEKRKKERAKRALASVKKETE